MAFLLRFGHFSQSRIPGNAGKEKVRNVLGDGVLLIQLTPATCTTPKEHDEFARVQRLASWPTDGAAFPCPAVNYY